MTKRSGQLITITVTNWNRYQGETRKNSKAKTFAWWARSNGFYRDEKMRSLGAVGRDLFASILDRCSERNANVISIKREHIMRDTSVGCGGHRSITRASLEEHLKLMQQLGIIEFAFHTEQNISLRETEYSLRETATVTCDQAEAAAEDPPNVKKLPRPIDPFAPKPDETPYVEIINLWNQICGTLKRRIEPFQLGPIRQNNIKLFWTKHPDLAYWEAWMQAYANSFWVLDPEQKHKPTNPEFDRLLEKTDLIYALLEGKYRYEDQNQKSFDARVAEVQAYLAGNGLGA